MRATMWLFVVLAACIQVALAVNRHGIIVDFGSTGGRGRLYGWEELTSNTDTLEIEEIDSFEVERGIHEFHGNIPELRQYLTHLMNGTKYLIASDKHQSTSIHLFATGVRSLDDANIDSFLDEVHAIMTDATVNPFRYERAYLRELTGEDEGMLSWLSVNYKSVFSNEVEEKGVGMIMVCGMSIQVAFVPESVILTNKATVDVQGRTQELYANSYPRFGKNQYIGRVRQLMLDGLPSNATVINDPCSLAGDDTRTHTAPDGIPYPVVGTGKVEECREYLGALIFKSVEDECLIPPCSIGNYYQPQLPDYTFYATGGMWYAMDTIGALNDGDSFSLTNVSLLANEYCSKTYDTVVNETGRSDRFISADCTMALYFPLLLTKGFNVHNDAANIRIVKERPGWTLGAMVYTEARRVMPTCADPPAGAAATAVTASFFTVLLLAILQIPRGSLNY